MLRDHTITLQGSKFHYTEQGDPAAPAIVMLHGITGHARTWDEEGSRPRRSSDC
jgi:pimeloyl-ACP methyl ester carboxylesterase